MQRIIQKSCVFSLGFCSVQIIYEHSRLGPWCLGEWPVLRDLRLRDQLKPTQTEARALLQTSDVEVPGEVQQLLSEMNFGTTSSLG